MRTERPTAIALPADRYAGTAPSLLATRGVLRNT